MKEKRRLRKRIKALEKRIGMLEREVKEFIPLKFTQYPSVWTERIEPILDKYPQTETVHCPFDQERF